MRTDAYCGEFEGRKVYLALFVDDGLLACKSNKVLNAMLNSLQDEFEITTGNASYFVGLQISKDRMNKRRFINQSAYIYHIINKFGMSDAKSV